MRWRWISTNVAPLVALLDPVEFLQDRRDGVAEDPLGLVDVGEADHPGGDDLVPQRALEMNSLS